MLLVRYLAAATPFSSIPGDYRFLNSPTDGAFRAEGNGCPTLSGGFELKGRAVMRDDVTQTVFESAAVAMTANPFVKSGRSYYNPSGSSYSNVLGFDVRSSATSGTICSNSPAGSCNGCDNGHSHGSSICISDGNQAMAYSGNLNSGSYSGMHLCEINTWCNSVHAGNLVHMMMLLFRPT